MFKNSLEVVTGVYVIAYTTALSLGQDPGTLVFSQPEMRRHLFKMLKEKETYYVSSVTEKAECESDRGQSHPSILHLQDAGSGRYDQVLQL